MGSFRRVNWFAAALTREKKQIAFATRLTHSLSLRAMDTDRLKRAETVRASPARAVRRHLCKNTDGAEGQNTANSHHTTTQLDSVPSSESVTSIDGGGGRRVIFTGAAKAIIPPPPRRSDGLRT